MTFIRHTSLRVICVGDEKHQERIDSPAAAAERAPPRSKEAPRAWCATVRPLSGGSPHVSWVLPKGWSVENIPKNAAVGNYGAEGWREGNDGLLVKRKEEGRKKSRKGDAHLELKPYSNPMGAAGNGEESRVPGQI